MIKNVYVKSNYDCLNACVLTKPNGCENLKTKRTRTRKRSESAYIRQVNLLQLLYNFYPIA